MADVEIYPRLFKAKQVLHRMLGVRGYILRDDETNALTDFGRFKEYYTGKSQLHRVSFYRAVGGVYDPTDAAKSKRKVPLTVLFLEKGEGEKSDSIDKIVDAVQKKPDGSWFQTRILLITENQLGKTITDKVNKTAACGFQHFTLDSLQFDPTKNVNMPKFRLLSETEKEELFQRKIPAAEQEQISRDLAQATTEEDRDRLEKQKKKWKNRLQGELPKDSLDGPIPKYFDAGVGDVLEITRTNKIFASSVQEYRTYRVVG